MTGGPDATMTTDNVNGANADEEIEFAITMAAKLRTAGTRRWRRSRSRGSPRPSPSPPGGLGTVDAALAALLTSFGATSSQALAADLVWRAASYLPQLLLGTLTFLWWRVTAARRRQRVAERSQTG